MNEAIKTFFFAHKRDVTTWFKVADTVVCGIVRLYVDAKRFERNVTKLGYAIFSGVKITISSCLGAVVLLEAVIQRCEFDGSVC